MYGASCTARGWSSCTDVLEQDRVILENLAPDARSQEFLYAHDAGLTWVRRTMQKMAERQLDKRTAPAANEAVQA